MYERGGTHTLQICQLGVVRVIEPRRDRNGVVGMKDVRRRRIVDDYGVSNRPSKLAEIFDVIALMVVTGLSE